MSPPWPAPCEPNSPPATKRPDTSNCSTCWRAQPATATSNTSRPNAPPKPRSPGHSPNRHFDAKGRLVRWPGKAGLRLPCLWTLWAKLPRGQTLDENQINMRLNDCHLFNDPALLRRELFDNGLVTRTPDCREYRRLEKRPPADALALIRLLAERGE